MIPLEGITAMSGHFYATRLPSHCFAYVLSMEHYQIPLILSRRAYFVSPRSH